LKHFSIEEHIMVKRILVLAIVLILLAFSIFVSVGQGGSFSLVNDSNVSIDYEAVRDAAMPLINEYGARVTIYAVVSGDRDDFTQRLQADGLATASSTNSNTFAIYIATEEQYSEIRWGSSFNIDGDAIRSNNLNPMLRERNFTQALVDALNGAQGQTSNPFNGITESVQTICGVPEIWIVVAIIVLVFILRKLGIIQPGDGSSSDSSWSSNSRSSSSSSRSSSSGRSSSSRGSSGGSSSGSWKD
jgi:hypothetical protein